MRLDDWQSNVTEAINNRRDTPYSIVDFNCLMWACEYIKAVNGEDYYAPLYDVRGIKYTSEAGAAKQFRSLTKCKTIPEYIESKLITRLPIGLCKKGDIVVIDPEIDLLDMASNVDLFGLPLGACYGRYSYFVGLDGLQAIETLQLGNGSYGFHC